MRIKCFNGKYILTLIYFTELDLFTIFIVLTFSVLLQYINNDAFSLTNIFIRYSDIAILLYSTALLY